MALFPSFFHLQSDYLSTFLMVLFIMLYRVVLAFDYVDEIFKCDHVGYLGAVLYRDAVENAVQRISKI